MTFRIKMLTAAAVLAIPAVAGAQLVPTTTPEAITQQPDSVAETARQTQEASESAQGTADETVRQTEEAPNQPVQTQVTTAQPSPQPTPEPILQPTPAPAETPPGPAQTQVQTQVQTMAQTETTAQTTVQAGPVSAATSTDLRAGVMVHDAAGGMVGTVVSADADSAVVSTGAIQAEIPLRSFGKNNVGLVISMTRAQLETAARTQSPG